MMLMCLFSPAVPAERLITRPAKATGRPARQAQQHLAASQPVRGGIEPTIAAPSADHVRELEPLGPTTPDHRPTNPAIAGPVVQHPSVAAGSRSGWCECGLECCSRTVVFFVCLLLYDQIFLDFVREMQML